MDIDTARSNVRSAFRIAADLQALLPFLKQRCDADEYRTYAMDIAKAVDAVNVALLDRSIKAFPELVREIEQQIDAQGRYV